MWRLTTVALLLSLAACREQVEETYGTWAEAHRAGAIERGWVPAFVPMSARNIRDVHDLDTNAQELEFTTSRSDVEAMVAGLTSVSAEDRSAAAELFGRLGFRGTPEVYVVCSDIRDGALVVDRASGRTVYKTPVRWVEDDCSEAP